MSHSRCSICCTLPEVAWAKSIFRTRVGVGRFIALIRPQQDGRFSREKRPSCWGLIKAMNLPTPTLVRKIDFAQATSGSVQQMLHREWLITNGLGGYASGTISGAVTWRYHGLLIAALPAPMGRTTMLNHLEE